MAVTWKPGIDWRSRSHPSPRPPRPTTAMRIASMDASVQREPELPVLQVAVMLGWRRADGFFFQPLRVAIEEGYGPTTVVPVGRNAVVAAARLRAFAGLVRPQGAQIPHQVIPKIVQLVGLGILEAGVAHRDAIRGPADLGHLEAEGRNAGIAAHGSEEPLVPVGDDVLLPVRGMICRFVGRSRPVAGLAEDVPGLDVRIEQMRPEGVAQSGAIPD